MRNKPLPNVDEIQPSMLYCTNRDVDSENASRLAQLPGDEVLYRAEDQYKIVVDYKGDGRLKISEQMVCVRSAASEASGAGWRSGRARQQPASLSSLARPPTLPSLAFSSLARPPTTSFSCARVRSFRSHDLLLLCSPAARSEPARVRVPAAQAARAGHPHGEHAGAVARERLQGHRGGLPARDRAPELLHRPRRQVR